MRRLLLLLVALLSSVVLVGCEDDTEKSERFRGSDRPEAATVAPGSPSTLREQGPTGPNGHSMGEDSIAVRTEVVTGSVAVTVDDPIGAAAKVAGRVGEVGGRVDSRTEQPGDGTAPRATLTVRVPADTTDQFLHGLRDIGRVTGVSTHRDDVTMQWEDLDARIQALHASVDRLRALVTGATDTADLIAAENALSSRQAELDSLTARKKHLDDQIALSTLTIEFSTDEPSGPAPENFRDGVVSGWNSLVDWGKDAVVFTGMVIPWLGFGLVIVAALWVIVRTVWRRRGRSKRAALPQQTTVAEAEPAVVPATEVETGAADADHSPGDDKTEQ